MQVSSSFSVLQPNAENLLLVNTMEVDDQKSAGLIKGIGIGLLSPGMTACKTIYLTSTGSTGDRLIDISIQSVLPQDEDGGPEEERTPLRDRCEYLQTLTIPTVAPLLIKHEVTYSRHHDLGCGPAHLGTYDSDTWDESSGGRALITTTFHCVECKGANTLLVEKMMLQPQVSCSSYLELTKINWR